MEKEKYICYLYIYFKCSHICDQIYFDFFGSIPNVISIANVTVKRPHDELSICCMTFAYLNNNCLTIISFFNNYMMSLGNVFVLYIVQCESSAKMFILTKIQ